MYSFIQYQLAKRWFLTGRYDYGQKPYDKTLKENAFSLTAVGMQLNFQNLNLKQKQRMIISIKDFTRHGCAGYL